MAYSKKTNGSQNSQSRIDQFDQLNRAQEVLQKKPQLVGPTDNLFEQSAWPRPFAFNEEVAGVFDDMISRSVPLYKELLHACCYWTARAYQTGTRVWDLGCSTGTQLELLAQVLGPEALLTGVDNSAPMLQKAQQKLSALPPKQVDLIEADISTVPIENCSVVIMNYTLQFMPVQERAELLKRIYRALAPGGLLILSEKLRSEHPPFEEGVTYFYESFKQRNGYSRNEIERKKEALENVLLSLTDRQQQQMLRDAGFEQQEVILRWHNFATRIASKTAPGSRED